MSALGSLRDHDDLIATYASLLIVEAAYDADPRNTVKAAHLAIVEARLTRLAKACGFVSQGRSDGDDLRRWVERRAASYGRAVRDGWPR